MFKIWLTIAKYLQGPIVIAESSYGEKPDGRVRIHCYRVIGEDLWKLYSGWVNLEQFKRKLSLLEGKTKIYLGKSDAMFLTSPKYVWSYINNSLFVWKKKRIVFKAYQKKIEIAGSEARVVDDVEIIKCDISRDWSRRTVSAVKDLQVTELVNSVEKEAIYDPTYDGLNLIADSVWIVNLGRDIANATGAKLEVHPDFGA